MKLTIFITKNILTQSMHCEEMIGQNCAIGKAIYALFGARSLVHSEAIKIYSKDIFEAMDIISNPFLYQIPLPDEAMDFIYKFDGCTPLERAEMTPIAFDIDIPEELVSSLGLGHVRKVISEQPQLLCSDENYISLGGYTINS